jgi:hypothetical protein
MLFFQGKHGEAMPHLEAVGAVAPTFELRSVLHGFEVVDPWVASQSYRAWSLWLLGEPERAAEQGRRALGMAEELDHPFSVGIALCFGASLHQFAGDAVGAGAAAGRALATATERGFPVLAA